ncbi:uncharacterized protein BDR25DRAFT_361572 [Lindgomyces ingoldianus]|uniref:Uncharacterized protein n=1 Tax=Lindgomyces ingoldianus TaxID=673940 RepID=A0ACB6QBY9_9PLEO|nr:uncharacterized protein BDR25DRAFT_361572 [Lindgomyces ingoldianus]KAF2464494.1 hypothetical protein BDR25DRAFT_361572 [Lindgomyces ingoldianus]
MSKARVVFSYHIVGGPGPAPHVNATSLALKLHRLSWPLHLVPIQICAVNQTKRSGGLPSGLPIPLDKENLKFWLLYRHLNSNFREAFWVFSRGESCAEQGIPRETLLEKGVKNFWLGTARTATNARLALHLEDRSGAILFTLSNFRISTTTSMELPLRLRNQPEPPSLPILNTTTTRPPSEGQVHAKNLLAQDPGYFPMQKTSSFSLNLFLDELPAFESVCSCVPHAWDFVAERSYHWAVTSISTTIQNAVHVHTIARDPQVPEQGQWGRGSLPPILPPSLRPSVLQYNICDFACLTMALILDKAVKGINVALDIRYDGQVLYHYIHSVILIIGIHGHYIIDLTRHQFGFPAVKSAIRYVTITCIVELYTVITGHVPGSRAEGLVARVIFGSLGAQICMGKSTFS